MSFNFTTEHYTMINDYKESSGEKTVSGALHSLFSEKKAFAWMTKHCSSYPSKDGKPTFHFVGDKLETDTKVFNAVDTLCKKHHHDFLGMVRLVMKEPDVQKEYKELMGL